MQFGPLDLLLVARSQLAFGLGSLRISFTCGATYVFLCVCVCMHSSTMQMYSRGTCAIAFLRFGCSFVRC